MLNSFLILYSSLVWAGDCPNLTGSFKCPVASATMDIEAKEVNGVWQYVGDQVSAFGPIYADGIERDMPGYGSVKNMRYRYRAYCTEGRLIVETKTRETLSGKAIEYGSREVYRFMGIKLKLVGHYYDDSPQRDPKEVNWEKDIIGRKVEKDFSFSCRRAN